MELQVLFIYFIACDRTSENLFTDNSDLTKISNSTHYFGVQFCEIHSFPNHKQDIKSQHHKKIPFNNHPLPPLPTPRNLWCAPCIFNIISGIRKYLIWLLPLRVMPLEIHQDCINNFSFLLMNTIPLYAYITVCVTIQPWRIFRLCLVWGNCATINSVVQVYIRT